MRGGYLRFQAQYLRWIQGSRSLAAFAKERSEELRQAFRHRDGSARPGRPGVTESIGTRWRSPWIADLKPDCRRRCKAIWDAEDGSKEKQVEGGKIDAGTRGEVTGGTQMGAMEVLVADILCDAGLKKLDVRRAPRWSFRAIIAPRRNGT